MINIRGRKTIAKTLLIIIAVILKSSTLNSQFFAVFRTFIDVRFSQLICGKNWHFSFYLKTIIIVSHSGVGFQLSCHLSPAIFLRMSQPFFQNVIATITNFCPALFLCMPQQVFNDVFGHADIFRNTKPCVNHNNFIFVLFVPYYNTLTFVSFICCVSL